MLKLTHCPHCQTTIQLPDEWMELDRIECPECGREFSLAEAGVDTAALSNDASPQEADGLLPAASPEVSSNSADEKSPTLESLMRSAGGVESNVEEDRSEDAVEQLFEFGEQSSELQDDDPHQTVDLGASKTISDLEGLLNSTGDDATTLEIAAINPGPEFHEEKPSLGQDRDADDHHDVEDAAAETVSVQSVDESREPTKVKSSSVKTHARKQRSPSMMRFAIMYVVSTAAAIWLGYLAVLWIQDARDHDNRDPFNMARFYPSAIVPEALASADDNEQGDDDPTNTLAPTERERQPSANDGENTPRIEAAGFDNPISPPDPPAPLTTIQDTPPLPTGDVRVNGAPEFDSDTLARALEATGPTIAPLMKGTLSEAEGRSKQDKAMSYAKVCKLAHVMTFCEQHDLQLERQAQEQIFQQILRYQEHRMDIAELTQLWLTSSKRSYGVFFCGSVVDSVQRGSVFEYTVRLPSGKTLPVIRPQRLESSRFADICILGELVKSPADVIPGYTGTRKQAIWSSVAFALPPAEKMPEPDPLGGFELGPPPAFE